MRAEQESYRVLFSAIADGAGAPPAENAVVVEGVMQEYGHLAYSKENAELLVRELQRRAGNARANEDGYLRHDILKVLLVTSGVLATAGNAYHVIAAHQMSEAECRWPVCKSVRENREEIHTLVEKLKGEELAT